MQTQSTAFQLVLAIAGVASMSVFPLATSNAQKSKELSDVFIAPKSGTMAVGRTVTVQFQQPMAKLEEISKETDQPPIFLKPAVEGVFIWRSAREGMLRVTGRVRPGTEYTLHLRPKLTDLQGGNVSGIPVISYESSDFSVTRKPRSYRKALPASPTVRIGFNYPVALAEATKHIYFQDRDSRERFAANVILPSKAKTEEKTSTSFHVQPAREFPCGKTIDLIADGLKDAEFQQALSHLQVFPLGKSQMLTIDSASAFYPPLDEPRINIRGSAPFDVNSVNTETVSIDPEVADFKVVASGTRITLTGKFDFTGAYKVKISDGVKSTTGYALREPVIKDAAFDGISASIYFPQRSMFQRTGRGVDFTFVHANTGELTWKLSHIPEHQLVTVIERNKEYYSLEIDPLSGKAVWDEKIKSHRQVQTELLTDALRLETTATGTLPAAGKRSVETRRIQWKPDGEQSLASGAYLLEVSGMSPGSDRILGNRSLIFFNDLTVTQKATKDEAILKVATMENSDAVTGAEVELVSYDNVVLAKQRTNSEGIARFTKFPAHAAYFLVRSKKGTARQYANPPRFSESGYVRRDRGRNRPDNDPADDDKLDLTPRGTVITDRNLYRPGREVHAKGMVRIMGTGEPFIPGGAELQWQITSGYQGEVQASGTTRVDAYGGWECAWQIPGSQKLGGYWIAYKLPEFSKKFDAGTNFQVQDFRVPLFDIVLGKPERKGDKVEIAVSSHYFHGGPNAGARVAWEAEVSPEYGYSSGISYVDLHSEHPAPEPPAKTWKGTATLDDSGKGLITLDLPIKKPFARSRFDVAFTADVISPEGRTITKSISDVVQLVDATPGVSISTIEASETGKARVEIKLHAQDTGNQDVAGLAMKWELFHVVYSTAKEKLGPHLFRYQNFNKFTRVAGGESSSGETIANEVSKTGRFVAVAWLANDPNAPLVSDDANMTGYERASYAVNDDTNIEVKPDKESYTIGDTAKIALEAPFGGKAWVSVETESVLEHFVADVPVNATSIEVPIKKSYFPNAFVTVYLIKPGGPDRLPVERFGKVEIQVSNPKRVIDVKPTISRSDFRPGQPVEGEILVTNDGNPVPNADLTVFAVDEAILKLGRWSLPDLSPVFFPHRVHRIATFRALHDHFERIAREELFEKGFLIGGGGLLDSAPSPDVASNVRRNFAPLAYWKTGVRTDANGVAKFDFKAPDNLTEFRITAVAQTKSNAFGTGKTSFTISKKLMVQPALPRFFRQNDVVELRAVARQSVGEKETIVVKCITDGGIELEAAAKEEQSIEAAKDTPAVFRFKARVGDMSHTRVRFEGKIVNHEEETDIVETPLLIHLPGLPVKLARYGEATLDGKRKFRIGEQVPENWSTSPGSFELTLSFNPWLPKLRGLPYILEYPHGCFEQKGSRYFTYTTLGELLAYLPDVKDRDVNYGRRVEEGMLEFEQSMLESGFLPYWPGGSEPDGFVTVLALWNAVKANNAGFKVPEDLADGLSEAMDLGIRGKKPETMNDGRHFHFPRPFALFVHSESGGNAKYNDVLDDLFRNRDQLGQEDRAFLALAMDNHKVMPEEKARLLEEIDQPVEKIAFNPRSFSSTTRTEAILGLAQLRLGGANFEKNKGLQKLRGRMLELLGDSRNLSTQENMWTLLLFQELQKKEKFATFKQKAIAPEPGKVSKNAVSVGWESQSSSAINDFAVTLNKGGSRKPVYYHVAAELVQKDAHAENTDEGFHLERTVTNLTKAKRTGTDGAPFQLGDELLITYRIMARREHHYVALTDELPAGVETVNFNLPQVAEFYDLPEDAAESTLFLSHSELRDRSANLYFNHVTRGAHTYSILARVTAAGSFTWPGAQVYPMYEERFGGFSSTSPCHSIAD